MPCVCEQYLAKSCDVKSWGVKSCGVKSCGVKSCGVKSCGVIPVSFVSFLFCEALYYYYQKIKTVVNSFQKIGIYT